MSNKTLKIDLESFTRIEREADHQRNSLPEAEVIEWLMQHSWTWNEVMELRSQLKGDCIWECWN